MTMIKNSVALVTGGSRGMGATLVRELHARGAAKVYATARDPHTVTESGPVPLALELTGPDAAAALARQAPDVTILINNAGTALRSSFLAPDGIEAGALEVLADDLTRQVKAGLAADPAVSCPQLAAGA